MLESIIQSDITVYVALGCVIASLILTLMGKVVFYNDFTDLGLSAALCFVPLLVMYVGVRYLGDSAMYVAGIAFLVLLIPCSLNTWRANQSIWKTVIVQIGKIALSFVYAIYLIRSMFPETKRQRNAAMMVLGILTPMLVLLVHDKSIGRDD